MKKSIKIIISLLIILMIALATKSYAAIETKQGTAKSTKTQVDAYQMCYDMRNPTSSLGNNNLDPHLSLNKDYGAWAYLGMSAYGNNGAKYVLSHNSYMSSTPNATGVIPTNTNASSEWAAAVVDEQSTTQMVNKYGRTKYLEVFNTNFNEENTRGMAITETKGWYSGVSSDYSTGYPYIYRSGKSGGWNHDKYGYTTTHDPNLSTLFRPVIWNGR